MPVIPAWPVRSNLNDPRRIPYLLIWKDERQGGEIKEAVRLARYVCRTLPRTVSGLPEVPFIIRGKWHATSVKNLLRPGSGRSAAELGRR